MFTPNPRSRKSLRDAGNATPSGDTTLTGLQRLPSHTLYPLTPGRFTTAATPSRSVSRFTPRGRPAIAPSTPYGRNARQQRAANTPGRDRRRSGRIQRETTFDILRNLGRALAPATEPILSSPEEVIKPQPKPRDEIEELDEESEIEAPELTLPIQEVEGSEEGSTARSPPRLSLPFDDDDITVEYPRRDISIRDQERLSIMSRNFGRPSDVFGDNQSDSDADEGDETGIVEDDGGEDTMISGGDFDRGGETADLGRFNLVMDFPSPGAMPVEDDMGDNLDETDGFELDAGDIQPVPASPSADENADAIGDFGFDFPPAPSSSVISGIAGGGLRDDGPSVQSKEKKISRHGIPVPNLPKGVVKKLAMRFSGTKAGSKAKINKAALEAIEQASAWYFEQASQDLAAYSKHAGRKTIDESDVATLMRRQRHVNKSTTIFSLAQKHLPRELQQDMRLAMPP
ncbi:hypothetical protein N7533_000629 [Penicillium manginii]|uniref:uncharacterized protein n=1 Tax=Penicillium manginii TaxID=203109 RepID=UPI002546C727|nr:uncharacterized protein N7533_000629 [Penicillium manginii]KAJ5768046.1 hypothetical protein N7533_000629 [Penicillium manginii]